MIEHQLTGVFYHQEPLGAPCESDEGEERKPNPYSVLRFFGDGTVVSSSVASLDLARDWTAISAWLNASHGVRGTYTVKSGAISFTITSPSGAVDYFGIVGPASMTLSWRSHINGVIKNAVEYVQLPETAGAAR